MFNAEIVAGSLLINETRKLAQIMLRDSSDEAWHHAVVVDNLLQKKTQATAKRMGNLIRHRLQLGDQEIWSLIAQNDFELTSQSALVLSIRHSQLLADFMRQVMGMHMRRIDLKLTQKDWDDFLQESSLREPAIGRWSKATCEKLYQVILRILAESKFLTSSKEKIIQPVIIRAEIRSYLHNCNDQSTLACLELHQ